MPPPTSWRSILILSSYTSGLSKWPLSLRFPHQYPVRFSSLPHTCCMPYSSYSSRFDHPTNVWWEVKIIKLLLIYFTPFPCYLVPLSPKYSPRHPVLKHSRCQRPCFTPVQNNRQNYISYTLRTQFYTQLYQIVSLFFCMEVKFSFSP
jgi:hypothetical protein